MFILFICSVVLGVINLILLFVIGAFLVRFKDRQNDLFRDLISSIEIMFGELPLMPTNALQNDRPKTWDEKYEEDLDNLQKRLRAEAGLQDLPSPGLSWGAPPAANSQNSEGLIIEDK